MTTPGHALLANDAFLRIVGMDLAEVRERGFRSVLPECRFDREGARETSRVHLITRGGRVPVEVSCTSFRDDRGERRVALIVRDLRERIRLEESLRDAVERATQEASHLAGVLEALPVAVNIADSGGRLLATNPAARELWGADMPVVPSFVHYGVFKARYRDTGEPVAPQEWALARALITGERIPRQHLVIERFDGERRYVANSAAPLRDPGGAILGAVAINIDETREVEAHLELETLRAELEERVRERTTELATANRELEAFSYTVAHDLRGPLRAIMGFVSVVLTDCRDSLPEVARTYLNRVQAAANRMDALIHDLLKLSRVTRSPLEVQPTNLADAARVVLDELREREPDRSVDISIQPDIPVHADPSLLQVLLENLLGNAWKFTRDRTPARIELSSEVEDGAVVVVIRDNGVGFDPAYAEQIFEPFERLVNSGLFEGSGIGLSIVRRIVDRHGGWIKGEGVPEQGATFRLTLASPARERTGGAGGGHRADQSRLK